MIFKFLCNAMIDDKIFEFNFYLFSVRIYVALSYLFPMSPHRGDKELMAWGNK